MCTFLLCHFRSFHIGDMSTFPPSQKVQPQCQLFRSCRGSGKPEEWREGFDTWCHTDWPICGCGSACYCRGVQTLGVWAKGARTHLLVV